MATAKFLAVYCPFLNDTKKEANKQISKTAIKKHSVADKMSATETVSS